MAFALTFLGTGDSAQVPVYNCACPACELAQQNDSFRRRPCSVALTLDGEQWIIDSGRMDLCELFPAPNLQGILQTHYHADHAQGLLHLRWGVNLRIPVWGPDDPAGFADLYKHPGILDFSAVWQAFETRFIQGFAITAVPLKHSRPCFGYVIEKGDFCLAYLTDTIGLPPATYQWLQNKPMNYCIVDCSLPPQPVTPRNHNDVSHTLQMCEGLHIEQLLLTHIGHELDEWLIVHERDLPERVAIAYDGMEILASSFKN